MRKNAKRGEINKTFPIKIITIKTKSNKFKKNKQQKRTDKVLNETFIKKEI